MNFQDRLVRLDQEKSYVLKKCWRELQSDTKRKKKKNQKDGEELEYVLIAQ